MNSFNWTCPYCDGDQAVTEPQISLADHYIRNADSTYGPICYMVQTIRCANAQCGRLTLSFSLNKVRLDELGKYRGPSDTIRSWRLLPESTAKPQPACIPAHIAQDYAEACLIRDLSPKASATLARRCLQGMIRDFCGIKSATLYQEIGALKKKQEKDEVLKHVHMDTVDALDHVRRIGNIGAHMESDVNRITSVEPLEAQKLIDLIELLFQEWYVQRDTRSRKLSTLQQIVASKAQASEAQADQVGTPNHRQGILTPIPGAGGWASPRQHCASGGFTMRIFNLGLCSLYSGTGRPVPGIFLPPHPERGF